MRALSAVVCAAALLAVAVPCLAQEKTPTTTPTVPVATVLDLPGVLARARDRSPTQRITKRRIAEGFQFIAISSEGGFMLSKATEAARKLGLGADRPVLAKY